MRWLVRIPRWAAWTMIVIGISLVNLPRVFAEEASETGQLVWLGVMTCGFLIVAAGTMSLVWRY